MSAAPARPPPIDLAAACAHLAAADPRLAGVIARVGPCRLALLPTRDLFTALLRSIVYQQLHGRAAATIHGRVRAVLRRRGGMKPAALLAAPEEELRAAGLSRAKLAAVRELAARCVAGEVPTLGAARRLSDDALVERLTAIRGIGPWTVHMLLIFHLGRPDVLPTGDFAVRLAFQRLYGRRHEPTPAALARHARRWSPHRTVASWYLWRSLELSSAV